MSDNPDASSQLREAAGAPGSLAPTWFAALLREDFALTVAEDNPNIADLTATTLVRC